MIILAHCRRITSINPVFLPKQVLTSTNKLTVIKDIDTIEKYLYDTKYLDIKQKDIKNDFSVWSLRRVDYIFINKDIPVKFNINKNAASDHYLIYCDVK